MNKFYFDIEKIEKETRAKMQEMQVAPTLEAECQNRGREVSLQAFLFLMNEQNRGTDPYVICEGFTRLIAELVFNFASNFAKTDMDRCQQYIAFRLCQMIESGPATRQTINVEGDPLS